MASSLVRLATVTRAHGLKGHLVVDIDPSMVSSAAPGVEVRLEKAPLLPLASKITVARVNGSRMVWGLEALSDRTAAETWAGAAVFVEKAALPEIRDDEYFDFELLGAAVVDSVGTSIGVIREIVATGANDVLVAHGPRGEVLVPATHVAILEIDRAAHRVVVDPQALVYEGSEDGRESS